MSRKYFLRLCLFFLPILGFAQTKEQNKGLHYMLVGTYTNGKSEGIYVYKFNSNTGEAELVNKATGIKNPSFLAVSPDHKKVYAVQELNNKDNGGLVVAYIFNNEDGSLTKLNEQPSGGDDPCYVLVDKTGKWLFVGNYSSGSLSVLPIEEDGSLSKPLKTIFHHGSSVNKERQEKAHVHSTNLSDDNRFLFVPDLGMDKVMIYQFNSKTGALTETKPGFASATPGSGPRHFVFHPNGKYAYLMEEMAGKVAVFQYNKNGKLREIQNISSHPQGYSGSKGSADIHVSTDGKFLYASNRGDANSIAVFSINQGTGKLKLEEIISTGGKTPRNFSLDPSGKFLLAANQGTDNIVIFKRDTKTGKLLPTGKTIDVPTPVCIKWIPVK